jgi:hypothetical protein
MSQYCWPHCDFRRVVTPMTVKTTPARVLIRAVDWLQDDSTTCLRLCRTVSSCGLRENPL